MPKDRKTQEAIATGLLRVTNAADAVAKQDIAPGFGRSEKFALALLAFVGRFNLADKLDVETSSAIERPYDVVALLDWATQNDDNGKIYPLILIREAKLAKQYIGGRQSDRPVSAAVIAQTRKELSDIYLEAGEKAGLARDKIEADEMVQEFVDATETYLEKHLSRKGKGERGGI